MSPVRIPGGRKPSGDVDLLDLLPPGLQDWIEDLPIFGDLIEIFTGREDDDPNDIGSMLNKLKSWVGGLFGFRASIASRVSAIEGKIATGAEFFDDFNRGENTGGLGNGWVQGGEGQPLGIRDQAAMIIQGGLQANPGLRWAKSKQPASGDTFTVSMVTHPVAPSRYAQTILFARMNAAFTEGLGVRMVAGRCWLSRVSRPSSTSNAWSWVDIDTQPRSYSQSATVEFKGEESVLQVLIDSEIVLTATDTVHAIDADHRENGFAQQTTTGAFNFTPEYSGALASYSLKSVAALQSVVTTAQTVATATVTPVASAVTAGASGAEQPIDADPEVYAAQKKLADGASAAAQAATYAQIAIQQQQQNNNTSGGGVKKLFQFASAGPLNSTDWTSNQGAFVQNNGQLTLSGDVAVNTFWIARPNYTFNTDDQAISVLLGDNANADQPTFLILRASADGTTGVACRITSTRLELGTIAFGGDGSASPGFSAVQGQNISLGSGASIDFLAIGNQFTVLRGGSSVLSYTGSLGTTGSTRRSAAVIMNKAQAFLVYYSFSLRSFGMNDYGTTGQAVSSRTSARLSRNSTGEVSMGVGSGGYAVVPNNFFGSIDFAQGMTVTDLSAGKIRIDTPGWYQVTAAFQSRYTGHSSYYGQPWWCLIVNGAQATPGVPGGVSLPVALAAGDIIQPGVVNYQSSVTVQGASDGRFGASTPSTLDVIGGNGAFFQAVFDI